VKLRCEIWIKDIKIAPKSIKIGAERPRSAPIFDAMAQNVRGAQSLADGHREPGGHGRLSKLCSSSASYLRIFPPQILFFLSHPNTEE